MQPSTPSPPKRTDVIGNSAFTLDGLISLQRCADLIADAEARGFAEAPVTTGRGFVMAPSVRNNTRVMYDDDSLGESLFELLAPHLPRRVGRFRIVGMNERFRIYRYEPGQRFRWHHDGAFHRSPDEQSLLTAMLYLNDDFEGGTTDFHDEPIVSVRPRQGRFLLFEHVLFHQGSRVTRGTKYVLRTDVMYRC